jgi:hypothetical protein
MAKTAETHLHVRLYRKEKQALRDLAGETGLSMSEIVRQSLEHTHRNTLITKTYPQRIVNTMSERD